LTINVKLRFVPNDNRTSDDAPSFRVFVGHTHVGDAWSVRPKGGKSNGYLRVCLDDPALGAPIRAVLFLSGDRSEAQFVWRRVRAEE
jgi:uncharacterized protein (DUF736 family)